MSERTGARAYWLERLSGFPGVARLGRPARAGGPRRRLALDITGAGYERLRALAGGSQPGVHAVLIAALAVVLERYGRQRHVGVGSPPLARDRSGSPAAAALPILVEVRTERSFRELLDLVGARLDEAYRHQDWPPGAQGGQARELPFDVTVRLDGLHAALQVEDVVATIEVAVTPTALEGWLEIDVDSLEEWEARQFLDYLLHVVDRACTRPARTVREVAALPEPLLHQVTVEWNRTARPGWTTPGLHRMFEEQAARRGSDAAVVTEPGTLGYAELNERANRLAHHLLGLGVRPDDVVGVCLERSFEMVEAVLGILKAGAAYVPLDPAQPPARLGLVLRDAAPRVVVTLDRFVDVLGEREPQIGLVRLDADGEAVASAPSGNPGVRVGPDGLACVIYTSGSTGRPKGVALTHRGLCNSLRWEQETFSFRDDDRLLHMASFSFSLAIVELLSPLCAGAQVVLAPPGAVRDTAWLTRYLREQRITILSVVPSELKVLLSDEPSMPWEQLRLVVTGADVLHPSLVRRFFERCPALPLLNVYGQTECSVECIFWTCEPLEGTSTVPVGRPLPNTQVYVLDRDLEPVPAGVPGELYIAGACLARGYLGQPALTAERFLPNPFAGGQGLRLYRGGDVARWRPDGLLELLGRDDHRVKVRGVRVELEEIETVLREHPAVEDAVVVLHRGGVASQPAGGSAWDESAWERLLQDVDPATVERLLREAESDDTRQQHREEPIR